MTPDQAGARARRTPIEWRADDIAKPEFTGVRVLDDVSLDNAAGVHRLVALLPHLGLKGLYPRILDDERQGEQARHVFEDAQQAARPHCGRKSC